MADPDHDTDQEQDSRHPGCAFLDDCDEDNNDDYLDAADEDDYGDEEPYHDDLEGFDDWHMDDDLDDFGDHDGIGDNVDYDDGDWCPDVPEELPELIFTEGCDAEAVDIAPCISLGHCSGLNVSSSSDLSRGGDVDAVRVMLLGVSESGRPSMGIDLGYACTQQSSPPSHAAQSNMPHRQHLAGDGEPPPLPNGASSPARSSHSAASSHTSGGADSAASTAPRTLPSDEHPVFGGDGLRASPEHLPAHAPPAPSPPSVPVARAGSSVTRGPTRSPPAFQFTPPRLTTRSPGLSPSTRPAFVFSEWTKANRQTFVFAGASPAGDAEGGFRGGQPCKFVPNRSLKLAIRDAEFVRGVMAALPGVDTSDERVCELIEKIQLDAEAEREASLVAKAQAALFLDSPGSRSRPGSAALRPAPVRRAAAPSAPSAPQAPVAPS